MLIVTMHFLIRNTATNERTQ